jgi:PPIC-type PPIASE domain
LADETPPPVPRQGIAGRLAREPLLHFAAAGALLFFASSLRGGAGDGEVEAPVTNEIVVTAAAVEQLAAAWESAHGRPPSAEERGALVQDYVQEEVYYREALAMGLDRDDTIIRRRLRQKLEFLADDVTSFAEATDEELAAFLAGHADAYRVDERYTLIHVFVSRDRGAGSDEFAAQLLTELEEGGDPMRLGDRTFVPPVFVETAERDLVSQLGSRFVEAVSDAPLAEWVGPVESAYGLHLVRVDERSGGRLPTLEEVRPQVQRDWLEVRRQSSREAFYRSLEARYVITIEPEVP